MQSKLFSKHKNQNKNIFFFLPDNNDSKYCVFYSSSRMWLVRPRRVENRSRPTFIRYSPE